MASNACSGASRITGASPCDTTKTPTTSWPPYASRHSSVIGFKCVWTLKLIGINAGHLPAARDTHSGISYMYKASAILDIIDAE